MRKVTIEDVQKSEMSRKDRKKGLVNRMKAVGTVNDAITTGDVGELIEIDGLGLDEGKMLAKLAKLEKEAKEHKNKFKDVDFERKRNAKELDKVRSDNGELRATVVELTRQLKGRDRELSDYEELMTQLKAELLIIQEENKDLIELTNKLKVKNDKLEKTVVEFENTDINKLRKEFRLLNGKLNDSNAKLNLALNSREKLNTKYMKSLDENKKLVQNHKELTKKFKSLNREHLVLVDKANNLEDKLSVQRYKTINLSMWSEKDMKRLFEKAEYKYVRDAFVVAIKNPENKLPVEVKKRFEDDVYFDELQKVKRDMAIIHLSDKKKPGFETMTSVGVLLDFGDGNFGFKNMNTDKEHAVVDLGNFVGKAYDGAVVRVELKKDKSVRVLMIFEESRGDQFFKRVAEKRKKVKATRTDGFGVSEGMKHRLNKLIGDRNVVLVSSGISNTMREYVSKHVNNIEFIDSYEMGTSRVNSSITRADICIIQPDKVPHSVTDVIDDKKDEKYVWAPGLNAREMVRTLFMHLNK